MRFLVQLAHVKATVPVTPAEGRAFIEQIIFPTLARAEQVIADKSSVRRTTGAK
jgi:hypothetical protein